eukprot:1529064-Rhodomonas_salina.4
MNSRARRTRSGTGLTTIAAVVVAMNVSVIVIVFTPRVVMISELNLAAALLLSVKATAPRRSRRAEASRWEWQAPQMTVLCLTGGRTRGSESRRDGLPRPAALVPSV